MRSVPMDEKLRVDPDHQDFLIGRAVEYPDPPTLGKCFAAPPKEFVLELLGGRLLKATTWHPCGFTQSLRVFKDKGLTLAETAICESADGRSGSGSPAHRLSAS
jgi:hypothetical protein